MSLKNRIILCVIITFLCYVTAVRKLENAVLKFYLVNAVISGKPHKVTEFFARYTPELIGQPEWREWFSKLP
jgi:hypothetical protein